MKILKLDNRCPSSDWNQAPPEKKLDFIAATNVSVHVAKFEPQITLVTGAIPSFKSNEPLQN